MLLEENSFYILDVTPRDEKAVIEARIKELTAADPQREEVYKKAGNRIFSQKLRPYEEVTWFTNLDKEDIELFLQGRATKAGNVENELIGLMWFLEEIKTAERLAGVICKVDKTLETMDLEAWAEHINQDRQKANFKSNANSKEITLMSSSDISIAWKKFKPKCVEYVLKVLKAKGVDFYSDVIAAMAKDAYPLDDADASELSKKILDNYCQLLKRGLGKQNRAIEQKLKELKNPNLEQLGEMDSLLSSRIGIIRGLLYYRYQTAIEINNFYPEVKELALDLANRHSIEDLKCARGLIEVMKALYNYPECKYREDLATLAPVLAKVGKEIDAQLNIGGARTPAKAKAQAEVPPLEQTMIMPTPPPIQTPPVKNPEKVINEPVAPPVIPTPMPNVGNNPSQNRANTSSAPAPQKGSGKGKIIGIIVVLLLFGIGGYMISSHKNDNKVANQTEDVAKDNTDKDQQEDKQEEKKEDTSPIGDYSRANSQSSLAGLSVGDSASMLSKTMGTADDVEQENGLDCYKYPSMDVYVDSNGRIGALVSNSNRVYTKKGIKEGDSLQDVLNTYGRDGYTVSDYKNLKLYEYKFNDNGLPTILRFAINSDDKVDYISARLDNEALQKEAEAQQQQAEEAARAQSNSSSSNSGGGSSSNFNRQAAINGAIGAIRNYYSNSSGMSVSNFSVSSVSANRVDLTFVLTKRVSKGFGKYSPQSRTYQAVLVNNGGGWSISSLY